MENVIKFKSKEQLDLDKQLRIKNYIEVTQKKIRRVLSTLETLTYILLTVDVDSEACAATNAILDELENILGITGTSAPSKGE